MHEFTDGCAGQYKSRHCLGDLSCSFATLGYTVQRNFFATSHAKGEQDAAGSHVKQKAATAVLLRRVKSVQLMRRIFFNLSSSCELAVSRNRQGGYFAL